MTPDTVVSFVPWLLWKRSHAGSINCSVYKQILVVIFIISTDNNFIYFHIKYELQLHVTLARIMLNI